MMIMFIAFVKFYSGKDKLINLITMLKNLTNNARNNNQILIPL